MGDRFEDMAKSNTTRRKKHPGGAADVISPDKAGKKKGILNDERTTPAAKHTHSAATRKEIRAVGHRVTGSRQSNKPVERSGQRRQPKTGGTGGHGKKK